MTNDEKDIADLVIQWKDEIKGITTNYNKAIDKLERVRKELENIKGTFLSRNKPWLIPGGIFVLVVIGLIAVGQFGGWCQITYKPPFEINSQKCEMKAANNYTLPAEGE